MNLSQRQIESIAKAIHDDYRRCHPEGVHNVPWEELTEDIRKANRDQAVHIGEYAKLLGLLADDGGRSKGASGKLTGLQIETAAKAIHEVWAKSKAAAGWIYGASRDDGNKIHPMLIPYEDLPEAEKEKDREIARNIVPLLSAAGISATDGG
ncbi:MAG: hypothetical protein LBK04_00865 [Clostridiales Family XIII bacterium]|jgi:hypothetical protein|nr:hypothetical protein [Clostridiales Family XIII bacterium]